MTPTTIQIRQLLRRGWHPYDVGKKMGCSPSRVSYHRRQLGLAPFPRGPRQISKTQLRRRLIRGFKVSGLSYSQIASLLGISVSRVAAILSGKVDPISGYCPVCGKFTVSLDRHHKNYLNDNVQLICRSCHVRDYHQKRRNRIVNNSVNNLSAST